jgi:hypothetical protein
MRFLVKLFAFGCALTAAILLLGLDKRGERKRERETARHVVAAGPEHAVRVVHGAAVGWGAGVAHPPEEVRILTQNGTVFMSLRGDEVVAGLSDSLREVVTKEMKREMSKSASGLGAMISGAVRSGVEKLLDKEITVPVSDIRDIDYRGNRIVIVYKDANRKPMLDFETIKNDDQSLLQQFSEEDARRLVDAVRVKIVTR